MNQHVTPRNRITILFIVFMLLMVLIGYRVVAVQVVSVIANPRRGSGSRP